INIEANEEDDESEEDRYKLAREGLEDSIRDKYAVEILWGTGYKHILLELKNLLDKVEEVTKEEKETFQNKTYLITNLSHDLKTPLTCIINSAYILKNEKLSQLEKEEEITKLTNQLERLKSLINDLNEIIDAEYTVISSNKENINICDLLRNFIGGFEEKLNKRDLELIVNIPKEPVTLYLDKDKIIRVFENIFSNIEKHSLEESRVYVDMNIDTDQGDIEIEFKNISKYEIDVDKNTIGNRFVQGDGSRNTDGHGLGISIIKSLIRTQGGNVDIKLDGDLFKITLKFNKI
ncbi:sensor histidine kinase, partial [Romboutsia weinsteinii]